MPELAEVEVVRRNLERWWVGRRASKVCVFDDALLEQGDADELREAMGSRLDDASRRGKYLIGRFATAQSVVFHFRMTGKIIRCDDAQPKYARLAWRIDDVGWLVFKDQRRLGVVEVFADERNLRNYEPLRRMGPEPEDVTVDHLRGACSDRRMLKTALLDQSIVAGVGNIAVSELFWRLRFTPEVKCGQLTDEDLARLIAEMPTYFDEIIDKSMGDEVMYVDEAELDNIFSVYRRAGQACPRCETVIEKKRVGGRSTYFCPRCQGE